MTENENLNKNEQDVYSVQNAGLCLLAPWFPRLFSMLGFLSEDRKSFRDMESQIRAIFLLQYLTCLEEKEYRETDLMLNRVLVSLPVHIPLLESLTLTDKEKQTAESLLTGVKANWDKMRNTSVRGFQQCFITRTGRLELQEEKCLLTVEDRSIDILLDSIPWSFRQIRYPWLKEYVQVVWHEK